jgi:hypothetical protein
VDDSWAYAASWAVVDQLASQAGEPVIQRAMRRALGGLSAYDPGEAVAVAGGTAQPRPLNSRSFLDQLDQGGGNVSALFAREVFPADSAALLGVRREARAAYDALMGAAGRWGAPQPIRSALEAWDFDAARTAIAAARAWLQDRDALLAQTANAGLAAPGRLAAVWLVDGGGTKARAELEAERALVDAYVAARARIGRPNPVQELGILGGPGPTSLLATAAGLYTNGDLAGAVATIERASSLAAGAQAAGVVRLAIGAALLAIVALLVALTARRLRIIVRRRAGRASVTPPSA